MTTGSLAVGRSVPKLKVSFYSVCLDGSDPVQIGGRDYNPDVTGIQASTAVNVGYQQATVQYALQPLSPDPAVLLHRAILEQREEARYFVHVVITDNTGIIWEGRLSALYAPGGEFQKFDATGYGLFAFQDYPIVWTNASASYTSGQILRDAVHSAAPMVRIGAQNAAAPQVWQPGIQYVDPGVPHTQADIANVKYVTEILNQITSEGNLQGQSVWYGVFERRTLYLLPTGVQPIDYWVDWDQTVNYKADAANMYGAVVLTYSGSESGKTSVTWPVDSGGNPSNPDWVNQYGLSVNGRPRTAHLNGSTLTDARALATVQTQAAILAQPTITAKVNIGGPVGEGEIPGIQLAGGGTRGPQDIRAGQTVQIGTGTNAPVAQIARTTLTVDGTSIMNVLELGQPYPDDHQLFSALRLSAKHFALSTNPLTGAPL